MSQGNGNPGGLPPGLPTGHPTPALEPLKASDPPEVKHSKMANLFHAIGDGFRHLGDDAGNAIGEAKFDR